MRRCPSLPLTIKVTHVTLLTALFYGGESLNRNEVSMHTILLLSSNSRSTAGALLLTIVAIEYGGWGVLLVVCGLQPAATLLDAGLMCWRAQSDVPDMLLLVGGV